MNYCEICETLVTDEELEESLELTGMIQCESCLEENEVLLEEEEADFDPIFLDELFDELD